MDLYVRDRMTTPVATITPETGLQTALRLMDERRLRRLPVVDEPAVRLVGVVAERDLLVAAIEYVQTPVEVEQFMVRKPVTVRPTTPLQDAAALMAAHHIGGLPVVDDESRVVGIITETDILRTFVELLVAA